MADKYLYNNAGTITEKAAVITGGNASDSGKIVALDASGKLAANMLPTGLAPEVVNIITSEALNQGDFVNIGSAGARKANASTNLPAHGFVIAAYASGVQADVYSPSVANTFLSGMTRGTAQFLGTNGAVTATPPTAAGSCVQRLGVASSATAMVFLPSEPIVLA